MSDDVDTSRRDYRGPYNRRHQIPTVQKYRQFKHDQQENVGDQGGQVTGDTYASSSSDSEEDTYQGNVGGNANSGQQVPTDTTEASNARNPKEHQQQLKERQGDRAERQVTDPVTHLPVTIRDYTDDDFKDADDNDEGDRKNVAQSASASGTSGRVPNQRDEKQQSEHDGLEEMFPPPAYNAARKDLERVWKKAMAFAIICIVGICLVSLAISATFVGRIGAMVFLSTVGTAACVGLTLGLQEWIEKKVRSVWEDEVWQAQRVQAHKQMHSEHPESTRWFNKLLGSIWPLINPDLFASLGDMLEDVMQASLPSMVRMVSIEDLGQGSDAVRILGVKWLPPGAAGKTVSADGKLEGKSKQSSQKQDEEKTGKTDDQEQAQTDASTDMNQRSAQNQDEQSGGAGQGSAIAGGMEAEDGDFMNLEIAFAYRSTHSRRKFADRAKHAHLYMAFYLPGNIKLPVWVELQGFVGSLRMRMQLTPDPPFVGLATMTFLGQPKVELSCTPLFRRMPNLMDLPLISNFVQSAVDAAMAEYVAPKSLTLDLKAMLAGDDFKKDTSARGVVVVKIIRAFDFKAADMSIPLIRKGSSDPYVSVGWAKFGKPLFSTRVLVDEMNPWWQEEAVLLVGPQELDAEENLRIQLWDSDKSTADDDLGRIEIPIKALMKNEKSNGKMWERTDSFQAMKAGDSMPGRLEWSVGYFTKTRLMDYQVKNASGDHKLSTVAELKEKSYANSHAKLREAAHCEETELEQLKKQDFEETSIDMISQSPPTEDYPSGIVSIQVHQITNLQLESTNRDRDSDAGEPEDTDVEQGDDLPNSYCTIILNHKEVFRTRTKPKNAKPFFNAGTERYVRDWRTAEVMLAVRDSRVHEEDALLGIVYLPLAKIFRERQTSQFNEFWPLTGGIGYGRVRISVVFRSIQIQLPPERLGWDFGTVEIAPEIEAVGNIRQDLVSDRLKLRTNMSRGKMHSVGHHHHHGGQNQNQGGSGAIWKTRNDRHIRLPVRNRYRQPLIIEFRTHSALKDKTPAFCVLWLHSVPDNEEQTLVLPVWKGDLAVASVNCLPRDQMGEQVGTIKIRLAFWRGIGKYHARYASKQSEQMQNVIDVLFCAKDQGLVECLVGDNEWVRKRREGRVAMGHDTFEGDEDEDESDDSDDSEREDLRADLDAGEGGSDEEIAEGERRIKRRETENEGGLLNEVKSYVSNRHALHRKHRGVMQFKVPRTLKWAEGKIERAAHKIEDKFTHHEREPGVETET